MRFANQRRCRQHLEAGVVVEDVVLRTGQARDQAISKRHQVGVGTSSAGRFEDEPTSAAVEQAHAWTQRFELQDSTMGARCDQSPRHQVPGLY